MGFVQISIYLCFSIYTLIWKKAHKFKLKALHECKAMNAPPPCAPSLLPSSSQMMLNEHVSSLRVLVTQSCPSLATPWTIAHQAPLSLGSSRQGTRVGCHFLLQGIFPTQGLNPGLPHCKQILYPLSRQGSPMNTELGTNDWQLSPQPRDSSVGAGVF